MTLLKLKSAPFTLIEDDGNKNIVPLVAELLQHQKNTVILFCYEQPVMFWRNVFKEKSNCVYYEDFTQDIIEKNANNKCCIVIDSVLQMSLCTGWRNCLTNLRQLHTHPNIIQIITVLHKDCLTHCSKLLAHLNHIANAVISYDKQDVTKIKVLIKKSGKVVKSEEVLSFDSSTSTLKSTSVIKEEKKEEQKPEPGKLSTFKIEVDQGEKLEKYKLKLPYMSKINEGESKVFYEPDAVDDWDEEDPDEDLDI